MARVSSVGVRMTTFGLVTRVPPMGNVMEIQTTHAVVSKLFPRMDNTVSQYTIKVSWMVTTSVGLNGLFVSGFTIVCPQCDFLL